MADNKNKKNSGFGFAIWFVLLLIIGVLFLINQKTIVSNLKTTRFFERTIGKTPEFIEKAPVVEQKEEGKNDVAPIISTEIDLNAENESSVSEPAVNKTEQAEQLSNTQSAATGTQSAPQQEKVSPVTAVSDAGRELQQQAEEAAAVKKETAAKPKPAENKPSVTETKKTPATAASATMNIKLYFMIITSNGTVNRREVVRTMKKSDSPLMDAVNALIEGPNSTEAVSGCRTLLSDGTRLLGASVRNGVATLNFSSEFEFNRYGIEGLRGQLQQLVYTATAFQTVESVQFLIDGEKKEYLGSEGVWIGTPLRRSSF